SVLNSAATFADVPPRAVAAAAQTSGVVTPEEHLGRKVGGDFTLADWREVGSYYGKLAAQSPNVKLEVVGQTTEGRDFLLATISSDANLRNLARLKDYAHTIADPRGKTPAQKEEALREGR